LDHDGIAWICMASFVSGNDAGPGGKGEVDFEITDAASDDANIKGVIVTVAEVRVNGQPLSGFTKQTIDLKAYQEGSTKLLGTAKMDARTYNNITLVLDLDSDADRNSPGCYVLTYDDVKFKLKSTSSGKHEIALNQTWKVVSDTKTKVVMDFDLRKSIRYSDDASIRYSFVSNQNLNTAVRVITRENSGSIKGHFEDESHVNAEKTVVYA